MGVLNIVVGSIIVMVLVCVGLAVLVALNAPPVLPDGQINPLPEIMAIIRREMPYYIPVIVAAALVSLVLNILLIVAGIGLLNVRPWGRGLSIGYSILTIVSRVGMILFELIVVAPALERLPGGGQANPVESAIGIFITVAIIGYAVVLLIVMLTPSVAAAFGRRPALDHEADRFADHDEYDRRRRDDEGWGN
jgi:hypothetical protein